MKIKTKNNACEHRKKERKKKWWPKTTFRTKEMQKKKS